MLFGTILQVIHKGNNCFTFLLHFAKDIIFLLNKTEVFPKLSDYPRDVITFAAVYRSWS